MEQASTTHRSEAQNAPSVEDARTREQIAQAIKWWEQELSTSRHRHSESELEVMETSLAALRASEPPTCATWLPIENAPKDGTAILAHDEGAVMIAWWIELETGTGWWDNGFFEPQHWMPLPAPPQPPEAR